MVEDLLVLLGLLVLLEVVCDFDLSLVFNQREGGIFIRHLLLLLISSNDIKLYI